DAAGDASWAHPADAIAAATRSGTRREAISRPLPRQGLVEFSDSEDLRPAVGARALNSRATILHGHLLRVLDLDLLLFLDAITLRHRGPPFRRGESGVTGRIRALFT